MSSTNRGRRVRPGKVLSRLALLSALLAAGCDYLLPPAPRPQSLVWFKAPATVHAGEPFAIDAVVEVPYACSEAIQVVATFDAAAKEVVLTGSARARVLPYGAMCAANVIFPAATTMMVLPVAGRYTLRSLIHPRLAAVPDDYGHLEPAFDHELMKLPREIEVTQTVEVTE